MTQSDDWLRRLADLTVDVAFGVQLLIWYSVHVRRNN